MRPGEHPNYLGLSFPPHEHREYPKIIYDPRIDAKDGSKESKVLGTAKDEAEELKLLESIHPPKVESKSP